MATRGTGHRRKLTVPMWSGRRFGVARRGGQKRWRGQVSPLRAPDRQSHRAQRSGAGSVERSESGQAAVETVALIPVFVLVALAMGQGAVAGYTAWSAAGAARVGARSQALGADPAPAVREELPTFLRKGAHVRTASSAAEAAGRVTVRLRVPSIVPGLTFGSISARALLPSQVDA